DQTLCTVTKYLLGQMRETDILVRYSHEEFLILAPKLSRDHAETLMSRLQNDLDHFGFPVRSDTTIPIPVSMGMAMYPTDGNQLENLIETAGLRLMQDLTLRRNVRSRIRQLS